MHATSPDVAAFILAGGKSSRMGMDKAFVPLGGRTLLARMLDLARSITPQVSIVGDRQKFSPFAPVVEDIFRDCGPLAGIHASLRSSSTDLNLILAVDVPFVSLALLEFLISKARGDASAQVTVARSIDGWQPLCAIYGRAFADAAEQALKQGRYRIDSLFEEPRTQVIGEEELKIAGFSPRIFRNLNTPEDLTAGD